MAVTLTPADFVKKWAVRFADNEFQNIREKDFREFAADIAAVFGVSIENVPEYQPGATYAQGFLVRYTPAGGQEAFYYSLQAGVLGTPGPANLLDWKVVPGPTTATALSQFLTLAQARNMNGDLVVLGRDYQIELPTLAAGGHAQYLSVAGIAEGWFASEGWLVSNNVRTKVKNIDYVAGTWEVDQSTALQAAVFARTATGFLGYVDLDSAFAAGNTSLELNRYLYQVKSSATVDDLTLNGNGASITLARGVTLTLTNQKVLRELGLTKGQGTLEEDGSLYAALYGNTTLDGLAMAGGTVAVFDQASANNFTGTGTVYLYDDSQAVGLGPTITVVDRRPGHMSQLPPGAPQWVAGAQAEGALVYDVGVVYRVKKNIANSQSAPAGNPANYERVGPSEETNFLTSTYTVLASDVTIPASPLAIAVAGALVFASVRLEGAGGSTTNLGYGPGYTSTPGVLIVGAGVTPAVQAGDLVRYSYLPGNISPVSVATRSQHGTSQGLRTTGGILFQQGQVPTQLVATVVDNIVSLSAQVNYRDPNQDSIWIAGTIRSSASRSPAALAALFAQVMSDIQAIPPAALAIAGELMLRTQPVDSTLSSNFFLDGLIPGRVQGESKNFRVTYTGPPSGNLFPNSQFQNTNQFWSVTSNWTYGGGQASIINGGPNGAGDALYCLLGVQAGNYELTVGVLALNSLNLPLDIECPQGQPATKYFINAVGDTVIRLTLPTGTMQLAFRGPSDVVLSHVYLVPVP